jgi:hypothetical protein
MTDIDVLVNDVGFNVEITLASGAVVDGGGVVLADGHHRLKTA